MRFDAYEISPVLETNGRDCEAFPSLSDAAAALARCEDEGTPARLLWTLYGHITGHGAEAVADLESEDAAFALLYKITGIKGVSGQTHYRSSVVESPQLTDVETARGQRDQFAYHIVRMAVALGIVDGKQTYTGEQVAFLADTALKAICDTNERHNKEYAAERKALLDSMPQLKAL